MIGRTLKHYRIVAPIGAGGMGEVYRAHDERLDRDVALKVLPSGALTDEAARKRFRKEAHALSRVSHPHVATLHDFDTEDGVDFLVMELVPGPSLEAELKRGPLPEKDVVRLGAQIVRGLVAAHEHGVIHRDLKPSNIRLTPDGLVKVLDFGLARVAQPTQTDDTTETASGGAAGTPPYMSPEQLLGKEVDARTDLYAAGAVLFEMATGRRPFGDAKGPELVAAILKELPPAPREVRPEVSAVLESVILKATDKDPTLRHQSARELLVDLERLALGESPNARVQGSRDGEADVRAGTDADRDSLASSETRRSLRRRVAILGAALAVGLLVLGAFSLRSPPAPRVTSFTPIARGLLRAGFPLGHGLATDGQRVYFVDGAGHVLRQVAVSGGNAEEIPLPFEADPLGFSTRRSELLLRDDVGRLFALKVPGGSPRRLGDIEVGLFGSAAWSPDGTRLAFVAPPVSFTSVHVATGDGLDPRLLVDLHENLTGLAWSPDGRRIRAGSWNAGDPQVVEIDVDHPERPPQRIAPAPETHGWPPGTWTRDGRYFIVANIDDSTRRSRLLARPEGSLPATFGRSELVDLLPTPDLWLFPVASPLDDRLFVVNSRPRGVLRRLDRESQHWEDAFPGLGSAEYVDFSRDGQWATWVGYPQGILWRARVDGTDKIALTSPEQFVRVFLPRWSPDGGRIVFSAWPRVGDLYLLFTIDVDGGEPVPVPGDGRQTALGACWSADGESLLFDNDDGVATPVRSAHPAGIQKLALATGAITTVPDSEGLNVSQCGPNGMVLAWEAAYSGTSHIFRPDTGWARLPGSPGAFNWPAFSRDGRFVYACGIRLDLETNEMAPLAPDERQSTGYFGHWCGLAPDGSPLRLADASGWDLYALELDLP